MMNEKVKVDIFNKPKVRMSDMMPGLKPCEFFDEWSDETPKKAGWLDDNVSVPLGIIVQDGESYRVLKPCFYNIDLDEWYWNGYRIMAGKIIKWFYDDEE